MDFPTVNYDQAFVNFYSQAFPDRSIPPTPQSKKEISLEVEMAMRSVEPKLYQNLCKPNPNSLPADLKLRRQSGNYWTSDVEVLEANGFTGDAAVLKSRIAAAQDQLLEQQIQDSMAKNNAREAQLKKQAGMSGWKRMMMKERTAEEIAASRAEYGITQPF